MTWLETSLKDERAQVSELSEKIITFEEMEQGFREQVAELSAKIEIFEENERGFIESQLAPMFPNEAANLCESPTEDLNACDAARQQWLGSQAGASLGVEDEVEVEIEVVSASSVPSCGAGREARADQFKRRHSGPALEVPRKKNDVDDEWPNNRRNGLNVRRCIKDRKRTSF